MMGYQRFIDELKLPDGYWVLHLDSTAVYWLALVVEQTSDFRFKIKFYNSGVCQIVWPNDARKMVTDTQIVQAARLIISTHETVKATSNDKLPSIH